MKATPLAPIISCFLLIPILASVTCAQQVPTPEDEVIAMLREWRAIRAAQSTGAVPENPVQVVPSPNSIVRIRVAGTVQEAMLVSGSQPAYPAEGPSTRAENTVTLDLLINADGAVPTRASLCLRL